MILKFAVALGAVVLTFFSFSVQAGHDGNAQSHEDHALEADTPPIELGDTEVLVTVNGVVCSFCAQGVEKSLGKLEGLDRSKHGNGVLVDIEHQHVRLAFLAGASVDEAEIREHIRKAGYDPVDFYTGAGL